MTVDDVRAAAEAAFPAARVADVLDLLNRYGTEPHERERERVQLAILKLSDGDEARLRDLVHRAKQDYRDVLAWTESQPFSTGARSTLDIVREEWAWALPKPTRVIALNPFGNVLVEGIDGTVWRVVPEDLAAAKVAESAASVDRLLADPEFQEDWTVEAWVEAAESALGPLAANQCYGFKIWPVLGSEYSVANMVVKSLGEWLAVSGSVGRQVKDLPPTG